MSILRYVGKSRNSDGQETVNHSQHQRVIRVNKGTFAGALIQMLVGWEQYAETHKKRYESPIGDDHVLGPYWAETGLAMKRLLDGETGGLDCGSIGHNILAAIEAEGFKTDGYSLL